MELSEKLRVKTQQNMNREELTHRVYLDIREDCLRLALTYFIEEDCKSRFTLGDRAIVGLICAKFKYKTDGIYIECDTEIGGSVRATIPMFAGLSFSPERDYETVELLYAEAKRLLLDIDYQLLRSKLRDYFDSYGLVGGYYEKRSGRYRTLTFSCDDNLLRKAIEKLERPKPPPLPKLPEATYEEFDEAYFEMGDSQSSDGEGNKATVHAICWVVAIIVLVVALGFIFFG